jgi:hypothetical protein
MTRCSVLATQRAADVLWSSHHAFSSARAGRAHTCWVPRCHGSGAVRLWDIRGALMNDGAGGEPETGYEHVTAGSGIDVSSRAARHWTSRRPLVCGHCRQPTHCFSTVGCTKRTCTSEKPTRTCSANRSNGSLVGFFYIRFESRFGSCHSLYSSLFHSCH